MLRRHLGPILAVSAAGLLIGSSLVARADEPAKVAADPASAPETVDILQAKRAGDLDVVVRGQGEDRVKFRVRNLSNRRLKVVLPPGLVAASSAGQAGLGGGGGAGGGFQSMGLGTPTAFAGAFGQFKGVSSESGLRSVPVTPASDAGIDVSAGQEAEFTLPSVCLNFGIDTPTPKDIFHLVDVNEYTPDPRVRKALRSLATLGTSQVVAQAVMWHVSNGLSFHQLGDQNVKRFSVQDLTLAARFVQAVDGSGSSDLVEPGQLAQSRIRIRLAGDGAFAKDAIRLASELQGRRLLGLPVQIADDDETSEPAIGTLRVDVRVGPGSKKGTARARVALRFAPIDGGWAVLGNTLATIDGEPGNLDGAALIGAIDRSIVAEFVDTRIARRAPGRTVLEVRNRLPFTIANLTLRAGKAADSPLSPVLGLGVGPARTSLVPIQAATGVVDRVELNGL